MADAINVIVNGVGVSIFKMDWWNGEVGIIIRADIHRTARLGGHEP